MSAIATTPELVQNAYKKINANLESFASASVGP